MNRITEIGPHKVRHGNVMDNLDALMGQDRADLFYSDPPWGEGTLKYWETLRLKMNSLPESERIEVPNLASFLNRVLDVCVKYTTGYAVIEYGQKWKDQIVEMAEGKGMKLVTTVGTKYRSGGKLLAMDLHLYTVGGIKADNNLALNFCRAVDRTHGFKTVTSAFDVLGMTNGIALDPCCGMGYTAQAAKNVGMEFRGNELNLKRLEKTIHRLRK